jgi:hypothetical protein
MLPVRRTASVKAQTVTMLHVLDRERLLASLKDFPEIHQRLQEIATSRVKRITRRLNAGSAGETTSNFVLDRDLQDMAAGSLNKKLRAEALKRGGVRLSPNNY